jgi:plastocyanin
VPAILIAALCPACTMTLQSSVRDQAGRPLGDAVVFATAADREVSPPRGTRTAVIVLENQRFHPAVLPLLAGTDVVFRNRDTSAHHLYSISPAKSFELLVKPGSTSSPVRFDRSGDVVAGCALNDRMLGRIYVLPTPYFARTGADGRAELAGLPRASYDVRVWHPEMRVSPAKTSRRVAGSSQRGAVVDFVVPVRDHGAQ